MGPADEGTRVVVEHHVKTTVAINARDGRIWSRHGIRSCVGHGGAANTPVRRTIQAQRTSPCGVNGSCSTAAQTTASSTPAAGASLRAAAIAASFDMPPGEPVGACVQAGAPSVEPQPCPTRLHPARTHPATASPTVTRSRAPTPARWRDVARSRMSRDIRRPPRRPHSPGVTPAVKGRPPRFVACSTLWFVARSPSCRCAKNTCCRRAPRRVLFRRRETLGVV